MRKCIQLTFALLCGSVCASAQVFVEGITVSGNVRDPSKAVVEDAHLTLISLDREERSDTHTDGNGDFQFFNVLPGRYLVVLEHPGFRAYSHAIHVGSRKPPPLSIALELLPVESEISVSPNDSSVSDPSSNQDALVLNSEMLSKLPVLDGDFIGALSGLLDQGVSGTTGASVIVDGMEVKDATISQNAVQQVRINDDPYSAEFWRPGRGRIEITTKSATDRFHGALGFSFRDAIFDARNTFALSRPREQRRNYDLFLTGPIRKNKDGFLLTLARNEDDSMSVIDAVLVTGPLRQNVPTPIRSTRASVRLAHDVSSSHRLSLQYNFRDTANQNYGVGGLILADAGVDSVIRRYDLTFNDHATLSPRKVNQLQVRIERYRTATTSSSANPRLIVEGAFIGGGAQATQSDTQVSVAANDVFTWATGTHQVTFGLNVPTLSRNSVEDHSNFGGTYYFSSLASYLASQPYLLRWQTGNPILHFGYQEIAGFAQDQIRLRPRLTLILGLRYDWQSRFPGGKNFAPRASIAYALDSKAKNIVRVGAGAFHDRTGPLPIADLLRYNGSELLDFSIANPTYPNTLPTTGAATIPSNIVVLAPNIRLPYALQYSAELEHQFSNHTSLAFSYRGSRDSHLFRSVDLNAPPPPDYLARPDPRFGVVRQIQSQGRQNYDGLDVTFRGGITKYFSGQARYTLSWTKNNTSGISYFPSNNYDSTGEWGRADWDQRHRLSLLGSAQAKTWFTIGVLLSVISGKPFTVTTGVDTFDDGMDNARPPAIPRNDMQGGGYSSLEVRVAHDFLLKRKDTKGPFLTASIEGFNILNHTNYNAYVGVLTSPFFGQPVSAYPGRRLQISLRLRF